ncbi:MAG: hypothetical protein PF487_06470 [Bacteroidales bacterium]|nr:hypothetical protein [Bacteroidales bacterium]
MKINRKKTIISKGSVGRKRLNPKLGKKLLKATDTGVKNAIVNNILSNEIN